jgi:hypothetical protein
VLAHLPTLTYPSFATKKKEKEKKGEKIAAQFIKIPGSNFSVLNFLIKKNLQSLILENKKRKKWKKTPLDRNFQSKFS